MISFPNIEQFRRSVLKFTSTSPEELARLDRNYRSAFEKVRSKVMALNKKRATKVASIPAGAGANEIGAPLPEFGNLVLAGGGGKGLVYPSVYLILEQAGFLGAIKRVAGSSAGALTAAAIAIGADPFEVASDVREAKYLGMMTGAHGTGKRKAPTLNVIHTGVDSGQEIYELFRALYLKAFRVNAARYVDKLLAAVAKGTVTAKDCREIQSILAGKSDQLNFAHLHTMHVIDSEKFKDLTITGSRVCGGTPGSSFVGIVFEPVYFNASEFPEMEIALAARISMSLPNLFKPIVLGGNGYVDGGVTTNVPVEVFHPGAGTSRDGISGKKMSRRQRIRYDKTLVLVLDSEGEGEKMLTSRENEGKAGFTAAFGVKDKDVKADWEKVYRAGKRSVLVLPHGTLGTASFLLAKAAEITRAQIVALTSTLEFLEQAVERRVTRTAADVPAIRRPNRLPRS